MPRLARTMATLLGLVAFAFAFAMPASATPNRCTATVRAMTYNIRLDTPVDGENDWSHRRSWLSEQIIWLAPDIFGLQEVVPGQKRDIAHDLPAYRLVGNGRDDGRDMGESSPIGFMPTRFDLLDSGTFWLSPTPDQPGRGWDAAYPRVATWVRLRDRVSHAVLLALNTHWDHIGIEARRQSGLQLRAWLGANARAGEHLILLGDFNTAMTSEAMAALVNPQASAVRLRDSRAASQTPPFGPVGTFNAFRLVPEEVLTIDHILVGDSVTVSRTAVVAQHVDGRVISDHYPVLADLTPGLPCPPAIQPGR
ncbi:MAG: endonuclease/exonuclease/phosphatase family protein, partial [Sphingopyxis sp.]